MTATWSPFAQQAKPEADDKRPDPAPAPSMSESIREKVAGRTTASALADRIFGARR